MKLGVAIGLCDNKVMGNTKIVKRNCNFCGEYYEGLGLMYCSRLCQNKDMPNRKDWHSKLSKRSIKAWTPERREWRSEFNKKNNIKPPGFKKGAIAWHAGLPPEFNPNWRGGTSSERARIMATKEYKKWRQDVYERDNYTCVMCFTKGNGKNLNADHIKSFKDYPELRTNLANGRTLCVDCHKKTDTYGRPGKKK